MQSLSQHTSYLFSMLLNDYIVDIEKPPFVVDALSELFSHPSKIRDMHKY